jgi:hypothetical protein
VDDVYAWGRKHYGDIIFCGEKMIAHLLVEGAVLRRIEVKDACPRIAVPCPMPYRAIFAGKTIPDMNPKYRSMVFELKRRVADVLIYEWDKKS